MSQSATAMPFEATEPSTTSESSPSLRALRLQAAVIRSLLDELEERTSAPGAEAIVAEQLAEELARLGRDLLRVSAAMSRDLRTR